MAASLLSTVCTTRQSCIEAELVEFLDLGPWHLLQDPCLGDQHKVTNLQYRLINSKILINQQNTFLFLITSALSQSERNSLLGGLKSLLVRFTFIQNHFSIIVDQGDAARAKD